MVYDHPEVPYIGPVISGCAVSGSSVTVKFSSSLLAGDAVAVSKFNSSENVSRNGVLAAGAKIPLPP